MQLSNLSLGIANIRAGVVALKENKEEGYDLIEKGINVIEKEDIKDKVNNESK